MVGFSVFDSNVSDAFWEPQSTGSVGMDEPPLTEVLDILDFCVKCHGCVLAEGSRFLSVQVHHLISEFLGDSGTDDWLS